VPMLDALPAAPSAVPGHADGFNATIPIAVPLGNPEAVPVLHAGLVHGHLLAGDPEQNRRVRRAWCFSEGRGLLSERWAGSRTSKPWNSEISDMELKTTLKMFISCSWCRWTSRRSSPRCSP
jgi:hypothetical protein